MALPTMYVQSASIPSYPFLSAFIRFKKSDLQRRRKA
jgi:hypothetical protein